MQVNAVNACSLEEDFGLDCDKTSFEIRINGNIQNLSYMSTNKYLFGRKTEMIAS